MNIALWIIQVLLAFEFLFAGGIKFVMSMEAMQAGMPVMLPGAFIYFIGVCEVLGALGLVLPGLFRMRQDLTPLAAAGLTVIMTGATIITLMGLPPVQALMPFVTGLLTAFVAYGRSRSRDRGAAAAPVHSR